MVSFGLTVGAAADADVRAVRVSPKSSAAPAPAMTKARFRGAAGALFMDSIPPCGRAIAFVGL